MKTRFPGLLLNQACLLTLMIGQLRDDLVKGLSAQLRAGWKAAGPK